MGYIKLVSGVGAFNWCYLSSPKRRHRGPGPDLETGGLACVVLSSVVELGGLLDVKKVDRALSRAGELFSGVEK
jgi:hypothetical protein